MCGLWLDSVSVGKLEEAKKVLQEAINTVEKSVTAQNEFCKVNVCVCVCRCEHVHTCTNAPHFQFYLLGSW